MHLITRVVRAGLVAAVLVALAGFALEQYWFGWSDTASMARVRTELQTRFNRSGEALGRMAAQVSAARDAIRLAPRDSASAKLLFDVVTDLYESLEALAKLVTGRPDKDLSGNRELFLRKVNASDAYKSLLKDYIDYANHFRHAESPAKPKPTVSEREAESFVYLTGVFIRLAIP